MVDLDCEIRSTPRYWEACCVWVVVEPIRSAKRSTQDVSFVAIDNVAYKNIHFDRGVM